MQTELQITVRDMEHSDALDQNIRERVARLGSIYPKLMGCRVVTELQDRHKHQGKHFAVRVDLTVPGKEIVVNQQHDEDVYVAVRDAFDAAKRQLEDYARIQRGQVKSHRTAAAPAAEEEGE
jgi:ribosomal subunit interface protein